MLIYAALEDAIAARIKAASDAEALGYKVLEIGSYGGEFDDDKFWETFRRFPAVWIAVGGDVPRRVGPRKWVCTLTAAVMVGTRNVRGERSTRHGSVGDVGSYQMLQDVRDLLAGQALGLDIEPLRLGRTRTLFNLRLASEGRSIMAAEFATDYAYTAIEANDGDMTGVHLRYYLKPGDDVQDAEDVVDLAA